MSEEFQISRVDNSRERYLIEYPKEDISDLLVIYLHSGLYVAEQGFCAGEKWCFGTLRDEVMRRRGVYVSPDYRGDSWLNAAAEADLAALLVELKLKFSTPTVILAGTSMGGGAALTFAAHHFDIVNGVIALCPVVDMLALYQDMNQREGLFYKMVAKSVAKAYGGTPEEIPEQYTYRSSFQHIERLKLPIVIRHGDADPILPIGNVRDMVDALQMKGTPLLYEELPGGTHDTPTIDTPWEKYMDFVLGN